MALTEVTLSDLKVCLHANVASFFDYRWRDRDWCSLVLKDVGEGCRYITKVVTEIRQPSE